MFGEIRALGKAVPSQSGVALMIDLEHQPTNRPTAFADAVLESRNYSRPQASQTGNRHVCKGAGGIMQPRDQLTQKEIQVATLVWEGLTNRDIAKVIGTS